MRYVATLLEDFARSKAVLLTGPRQVGKTTLAREWLGSDGGYLNWDVPENRARILERVFPPDALVLDEVHKYPRWKAVVKGIVDGPRPPRLVVTGSSRLDTFQRGGDSLLGRTEYLRLHPFSIGELTHGKLVDPPADWLHPGTKRPSRDMWSRLETRGGFPEPYTRDDPRQHRRWSTRRRTLLVHEDLREISQIRSLALVEHLTLLLPHRVGSPLSVNALREDLGVAHDTVTEWLLHLDRLYFCFRVAPFSRRLNRAIRKEQKLYLWDWSTIVDPAARFENMVASHLLKAVHAWTDAGFGDYALHYWRNKDGHEVDFVVTEDRSPVALFECKLTDPVPSPSLIKLMTELNVPALQLVSSLSRPSDSRSLRVVQADEYLAGLV